MPSTTLSRAEQMALTALALPAFQRINLSEIRNDVAALLGHIGRDGFFDEYTKHDMSHVDGMLNSLDWLIPPTTAAIMSPTDWLLTVLAIYFHDLGMLVTKTEFAARNQSPFIRFKEEVLGTDTLGTDYRDNLSRRYPLPDAQERFLYQEYIRRTHPARVAAWLRGVPDMPPQGTAAIAEVVQRLVDGVDIAFQRDLALVCESHHLDDLGDAKKYPVSRPYGNSAAETANVQYAAILLRSADLLHVTQDRTPSVEFRVINPTDPTSQVEWAKQMAVRAVRPRPQEDGDDPQQLPQVPDTIEVHATFTDADGFFGLTAFLTYANGQLRKSHEWADASRRTRGANHEFPWRHIDDSHIEAIGFLSTPFSFDIDQQRILDLLTGHTLYNDTSVVIRELVQNSLDAFRLQSLVERQGIEHNEHPAVSIEWDTATRVLTVRDSGTGMTQSIIERHLLRVGSSRYHDPEFQKAFPSFSPISRFGIGVLSCFMVADEIEILTSHDEEIEARHLTLRSVHGRYLIRLIKKEEDGPARGILPHGTEIRLRLRSSAGLPNVLTTVRRWVLIPGCRVHVVMDGGDPVVVGFRSPREALIDMLKGLRISVDPSTDSSPPGTDGHMRVIRVHQTQSGPVTIAYAVVWSPYFREWTFLSLDYYTRHGSHRDADWWLGTAVEGIRVQFGTPGFEGVGIAAIANAAGPLAPRTNVARSSLEDTPERREVHRCIYGVYASHVTSETASLHTERGFSVTWATQEATFLLRALSPPQSERRIEATDPKTLLEELDRIPVLVAERNSSRSALPLKDLAAEPGFWVSEGGLIQTVESLLREVRSTASISSVLEALDAPDVRLPDGLIVASAPRSGILSRRHFEGREVSRIVMIPEQRRVDLYFEGISATSRWRSVPRRVRESMLMLEGGHLGLDHNRSFAVARGTVPISGADTVDAISTSLGTLILSGNPLHTLLSNWLDRLEVSPSDDLAEAAPAVFTVALQLVAGALRMPVEANAVRILLSRLESRLHGSALLDEAVEGFEGLSLKIFNPGDWDRRSE